MENEEVPKPKELNIPAKLIQDESLTDKDGIVFGAIYWVFDKFGECRANNEYLELIAGCTKNTLGSSLNRLEKNGYISRIYRDTEDKHRDRIVPLFTNSWVTQNFNKGKEKESNQRKHQTKIYTSNTNKPNNEEEKQSKDKRKKVKKKKKKEIRKEFIRKKRNQISSYYKKCIQPNAHLTDKSKKKIEVRLKEFSSSELRDAIDNFADDDWWMDNNAHRGMAWFFRSEDQVEKFLNLDQVDKGQSKSKTIRI